MEVQFFFGADSILCTYLRIMVNGNIPSINVVDQLVLYRADKIDSALDDAHEVPFLHTPVLFRT